MLGIDLKHSLATVAVAAGVLASAGSASAAYQHNQTDLEFPAKGVKDGTSNTIMFGERAAAPRGFSIDIGSSENIASDGLGAAFILMADSGGQF